MSVVQKHVFVCTKQKPEGIADCAEKKGTDVFNALKAQIYKMGKESEILVSESGCMGVCNFGPTVVVYPEAHWYTRVQADEIPKIIEEHLIGGTPVDRENLTENEIKGEHQSWHVKSRMHMVKHGIL